MIFFKDKNNSPYSVAHPEDFLSDRSLARRAKQSIAATAEDFPVNTTYIAQARAAGAHVYFSSRWQNGVLAEIDLENLDAIKNLAFVSSVEFVAPGGKLQGGRVKRTANKFSVASTDASQSLPQLAQLQIDRMHGLGFHGEGILIGIMDGGFASVNVAAPFADLFTRNAIKYHYNFVLHSTEVYAACDGCEHGTEVLSTIAVNTANYTGAAYGADFCLFVTEDGSSEYRIEEYNWLFAAEKADSIGVDVISTSLGYNLFDDPSMDYKYTEMDGKTSAIARAATTALSKGMVFAVSAGNEGNNGWQHITTPGDTPGALTVGAVNNSGEITSFSSIGPSADGRIKPDVVAQGSFDAVILPSGAVGTNSGTSFACPLIAGLAAGVWQAYPFLSAGQVYDVIVHSANRASAPNNIFGYGIPHFGAIADYVSLKNTISVYPNPYEPAVALPSDINVVKVAFGYGTGEAMITISDLLGKTLSSQSAVVDRDDLIVNIDITGISSGMYLIRIKNKISEKIFRFVKH